MSFFPRTLQRLGCFDFSFAKVGEARALQVPQAIPAQNSDTLSAFSS
jgi:hypothetical protein